MIYHVKCYEVVNFTVAIEAESSAEAEDLALADINSIVTMIRHKVPCCLHLYITTNQDTNQQYL